MKVLNEKGGVVRRYQDRLDQLVEDLDLTFEEREFIHLNSKSDPAARRVASMIGMYLDATLRDEKQGLLRQLVQEAVPALRTVIEARSFVGPAGYQLVSERQLEALRELAVRAIRAARLKDQERYDAIRYMAASCEPVINLDEVVAAEVQGLPMEDAS